MYYEFKCAPMCAHTCAFHSIDMLQMLTQMDDTMLVYYFTRLQPGTCCSSAVFINDCALMTEPVLHLHAYSLVCPRVCHSLLPTNF